MKKIGIITAWDSPFVYTAPMFNMLNWERPEGYQVKHIMGVGWCPANRHNDGVEKAQKWGADLIMFNGADHLCPKDIIPRMVKRIDEGWDMVQAMIPSRGICGVSGIPFDSISYRIEGPMPEYQPMIYAKRESVKIIDKDGEPQQSSVCGTGDIMMKAEILNGMVKPYFTEVLKPDKLYGRWPVQDSTFVYNCTVIAGARMLCDTTIKLRHIDIFPIDETYSERFKDKTGNPEWSPAREMREFI